MEANDQELIRSLSDAAKGPAARELYRRHSSTVFGFAFRLCGDRALAEDICQEVFAKLAERPPDQGTPLRPWLLRVTRNLFIDFERRRVLDFDRMRDLALWPSESVASPELALEGASQLGRIELALQEMPVILREAIVLVCMQGLSATEAAEVLEVSAEAVRQRVTRGRARLRQALHSGDIDERKKT